MMIAKRIPVGTRVDAPGIAPAVSRVRSAISAKDKDLDRFQRALLGWYEQHGRDLPWRKKRDPYPIWVSEIMLQQTRAAAVIDHYRMFLTRFPNAQALAAASEEAVLAAWSGLGYYRRARLMHQCARQIGEEHGGCFPRNSESLRALPGIGRYTAAAIASLAFGEPVAVVDGNVERVLRRLIGKNTTGVDLTTAQIWQHAQALLAGNRPGDFNQAMMELGATVCLPREPRCAVCPVRRWCATQGEHPRTKQTSRGTSRQRKKEIWCALEWRNGKGKHDGAGSGQIRLVQRNKEASLMPGMWELPQWSGAPRVAPVAVPWRTFRHSITNTDYTVHVMRNLRLRNTADARLAAKGKWVASDRLAELPITGLTRKILRASGII
jgi:A/G-specific adenine glycosylase